MSHMNPVLARMAGRADPSPSDAPSPEAGAARQLRVALMRAADRAIGLALSVIGVTEEAQGADALVESGPQDWMVLGLHREAEPGLAGLALVDKALRTAMIEMQTMGMLMERGDEDRPVTATDAVLSQPVIEVFLQELAGAAAPFGPRTDGLALKPLPDLRAAGLMLRDLPYQCWTVTVQIGGTDRQGSLQLALATSPSQTPKPQTCESLWSDDLRSALEEAPAELEAVLCRMRMPISRIEGFGVGDVIALPGTTVGSVMLEGPGQQPIATARLGQVSGLRAVRMEVPETRMSDMAAPLPRQDDGAVASETQPVPSGDVDTTAIGDAAVNSPGGEGL